MATWGIETDFGFINIKDFKKSDWKIIRSIRDEIMMKKECDCPEEALLCAFVAYIYIKMEELENAKKHIRKETDKVH